LQQIVFADDAQIFFSFHNRQMGDLVIIHHL
jgi:hypothetical protein